MLYCDDYTIVDTSYIVHACMVDPCLEHDEKPFYLIALILHVGHMGHLTSVSYPQRHLRDMAFEAIVAIVKRETADVDDEEDT